MLFEIIVQKFEKKYSKIKKFEGFVQKYDNWFKNYFTVGQIFPNLVRTSNDI